MSRHECGDSFECNQVKYDNVRNEVYDYCGTNENKKITIIHLIVRTDRCFYCSVSFVFVFAVSTKNTLKEMQII